MRILLISFMVCLLLGGCAKQNSGGTTSGSSSSSHSSSSTSTSTYTSDLSTMGGMMDYLRVNGMQYDEEMEIAELEKGFEEGRKFTSNGVSYGLFRYDEANTEFANTINEARTNGYMHMRVNGKQEKVPVHVYKNYVLAYPQGHDISEMLNYFR